MERYTSEQALNGILNILETVVGLGNKNDKKDETSDMIRQLLQGAATAQAAGLGLGQQIEQMANGLDIIKSAGINDADVDMVAGSITRLATALNSFSVNNEVRSEGVVQAVSLLRLLGSVEKDTVRNIERLVSLDVDDMKQFNEAMQWLKAVEFDQAHAKSISILISELNALGGIDKTVISGLKRIQDINPKSFERLSAALAELNANTLDRSSVTRVNNAIAVLNALSGITTDTIDAINDIRDLKVSSIERLNELVSTLDLSGLKKSDVNLAKLLTDILKALGSIDEQTLDNLSNLSDINPKSFEHLSAILASLNFKNMPKSSSANALQVINVLRAFGSITEETIDNLNNLSDIDTDAFNNLIEALQDLDFSKIKHISGKDAQKNLQSLSSFISQLNTILGDGTKNLSGMFSKYKARRIGKTVGAFYEALFDTILGNRKNIVVKVEGVAELMNAIMPLISDESPVSVYKMKKVLNQENGRQIGMFFKEMLAGIPNKKKPDAVLKQLADFLKLITSFGLGDYIKLKVLLTEKNGKNMGKFFSSLFDGLEKEKYPDLKPITTFLKQLSSIGIVGALGLLALKPVLTEKFGKAIAGFVNALVKDMDKDKLDRISTFTKSVKMLSTSMLIMAATIGLLAAEITFFGAVTIIQALAINVLFVGTTIMLMRFLGKSRSHITTGATALKDIAKALTYLSIDVAMMAIVASFLQNVEWESLGKVASVVVLMTGVAMGVMYLANKWKKGGDNAIKVMQSMSILIASITISIGLIALMTKVASIEDIRAGALVVVMTVALMTGIVWWMSKINKKNLEQATSSLIVVAGVFTVISLVAAFILPAIAKQLADVIEGGLVVMATVALMTGIVHWLSKIDKKNLKQATTTLVAITGVFTVISLVALFILPNIGKKFGETMAGAGTVILIIGLLTAVTAGLAWLDKKGYVKAGVRTLVALTAVFTVLSFVAMFLLPAIGKNWKEAAVGGLVVTGIVLAMVVITMLLSWLGKNKKMDNALITLGALTLMLLTVSLITTELLIPIGLEWKEAAAGGAVVVGVIGMMVVMTILLSRLGSNKKMTNALITLGALTLMLLVVSLIVSELLIPIGYEWKEAAIGGTVVIGVIGIMSLIVYGLSKIPKKKAIASSIILAAIAATLWAVSEIIQNYFIPIGEEAKLAMKGGMVIVGTIGIMALIIAAAGKMSMSTIAKGGLVIAGIGGILYLLGNMLPDYIDLCVKMAKDAKRIAIGGAEIAATLVAWGVIMVAVGALMTYGAAWLAMGAAAITGIAGVLYVIAQALPDYFELAIKMAENSKQVTKGSRAIEKLIGEWGLIMAGIGAMLMLPFVGIALVSGAAAMVTISGVILAISKALDPFVDVIIKMKEHNINERAINSFTKTMIGNGMDDKNSPSLIGSIINITEALEKVGVWTAVKAGFIARNIRPIFETIGMFIDIIGRICSMKYVSEWDDEGKPLTYETLTLAMFREAGNTISVTFGTFLKELGNGLEKLKDVSYATVLLLAAGIGPVMNSVKSFTDAILSVLSSKIPDEYDKEGKPIKFRKFEPGEFATAAGLITDAFLVFLENFSAKSKNISARSAMIINMFKDGIEPVMNAVATWTNTIMDFVTGRQIEYTDAKTGKVMKEIFHISPEKFKEHGKTVADTFIGFIDGLWTQFSALGYTEHRCVESNTFSANRYEDIYHNHVTELITGFLNIGEIMGAVETFINLIFNVAEKAGQVDLKSQGELIGDIFIGFVNKLCDAFFEKETTQMGAFKFEDTVIGQRLTATLEGLEKVKKVVVSFDKVMNELVKFIKKYDNKITTEQIDGIYGILTYFIQEENIKAIKGMGAYDLKDTIKFMKSMTDISEELEDIGKNMKQLTQIENACNTLVNSMQILKQNSTALTGWNIRDAAMLVRYLDKLSEATKELKKFERIGGDASVEIKNGVTLFMSQVQTLQKLKTDQYRLEIEDVVRLPRYMQKVVETAKLLVKLSDVMQNPNITEAVNAFLKDINAMTQKDLANRTLATQRAMRMFSADVKQFTATIADSRKTVIKFTSTMKDATDALRKFDDAIITREKQRNDALQKFAEMIQGIAESVGNLQNQINTLDENKIMSNFRGIGQLFEMIKGVASGKDDEEEKKKEQSTTATPTTQLRRDDRREPTPVVQPLIAPGQKMMITMNFQNTRFTGFMETTPL